ncbi:DUF560 domain-containing protein [Aquicoccus sp. SCR17]|nr:DUF560 domain-containing protein [Carideicomes alvinocaridis]
MTKHFSPQSSVCTCRRPDPPGRRFLARLCLALLLCLACASPGLAREEAPRPSATAPSYARATRLAAQGELEAAVALLRGWTPTTRSEREQRLWALAVILRSAGRAAEALPLLEDLVRLRPDVPRFRIALGEVLADRGQTERARFHLEEARLASPSEADRARAERGLGALDAGSAWSGHVSLALIPATNAAQGTNARRIRLGGLDFDINRGSRERPAFGIEAGAGLAYAPAIGPATRLRFGLSGKAELYDGNAPDDITLRAEAALVRDLGDRALVEGGLTWSRRWIDGAGYSAGPGLTFGYSALAGPRGRVDAAVVVDRLDHDRAPGLDGYRSLAVLAYTHALSPRLHLRGSLRLERMAARTASLASTAWEAGLGGTYAFENGLRLGLDFGLRQAGYDAPSALFGARREDRRLTTRLRLTQGAYQVGGFAPVLEVEFERQDSTIPLYRFENLSTSIGLTRRF